MSKLSIIIIAIFILIIGIVLYQNSQNKKRERERQYQDYLNSNTHLGSFSNFINSDNINALTSLLNLFKHNDSELTQEQKDTIRTQMSFNPQTAWILQ